MLYAITDRRLYGADEESRRTRLLDLTTVWAASRVNIIQLREKDLSSREQVELARAMLKILRAAEKQAGQPRSTRLLIHGRPDVALVTGADGVHLPSDPDALTPEQVREIFASAKDPKPPYMSLSCHTLEDIAAARRQQAGCVLFAPVFEKRIGAGDTLPGTGLELLAEACRSAAPIPVFALGGVTVENAQQCIAAGAAGIAAIRLMLKPPSSWHDLA